MLKLIRFGSVYDIIVQYSTHKNSAPSTAKYINLPHFCIHIIDFIYFIRLNTLLACYFFSVF